MKSSSYQAKGLLFLFCFALLALISLSGCASRQQVLRCQEELLFIRGQLQTLNRRIEEQQTTLQNLNSILLSNRQIQNRLDVINDSLLAVQANIDRLRADMTSELVTIKEYANYLNNKFEDVNTRSGKLLGKVESLTNKIAERTTSSSATADDRTSTNPVELFNSAYLDMTRGNYQLAQQGFRAYLELFPESDLADYCHFYLAEIFFQNNEYNQAISEYNVVLTRYPHSQKVANSMLKMGICYKQLNEPAKARQYFNDLIQKFPNTEEAAQARARL